MSIIIIFFIYIFLLLLFIYSCLIFSHTYCIGTLTRYSWIHYTVC